MAGQHGGARDLGLRGSRASGVAGEAALRHHPGQKGLVLADYAGDANGVVWRAEEEEEKEEEEKGEEKKSSDVH